MSAGRVIWVCWCLLWAGVWAVVSLAAWTGTAAQWQDLLFPVLAASSAAAAAVAVIRAPAGTHRRPAESKRESNGRKST
jgi:hypothetical protein